MHILHLQVKKSY